MAAHTAKPVDSGKGVYEALDPSQVTPDLVSHFQLNSVLLWAGLPGFAMFQGFGPPPLQPTCDEGYSNISLLGVVAVAALHAWNERNAWWMAKSLLTAPEISIMRQLGVLRSRRRKMLMGLLEVLDLYNNLIFPWVARACDLHSTEHWLQSWKLVPFIGEAVAGAVGVLRFWGCALILSAIMVVVGLIDATRLCYAKVPGQPGDGSKVARMTGEDFFTLARFAGNCMMPSVASLCEEMAGQKRWLFRTDHHRQPGGVKPVRDAALGHITAAQREAQELHIVEEAEKTDAAGVMFLGARLLVNVLIGVILQLWVQASFFELVYGKAGTEMRIKLAAGMGISAFLVAVRSLRCYEVASKLGCFGVILIALSAFFVAWTIAKVYGGMKCEDHIWNLSSGCVTLDKSTEARIGG